MDLNDRRSRWVTAFARLKPGVTLKRPKPAIQPFFHQILNMEVRQKEFAKAAPEMKKAFLQMSMDVLPAAKGRSNLRRQFSKPLLVLMATVLLVLLIACANVANLLIARATFRQKEIAVRLALGSSRARIIRQLLVESMLLALAGGAAGLRLAVWADRILILFLRRSASPLAISSTPDWRILWFHRRSLAADRDSLRPGTRTAGHSVQRGRHVEGQRRSSCQVACSGSMRKILVTAQIALSLLLLIGAGLFIRSLQNLKDLDPGFRTANLLAFKVDPIESGYTTERTKAFYESLRQESGQHAGC